MRLEQVTLHKNDQVQKLLEYYMGKNTMERQNFIIDNLVIEEDIPEEDSEPMDWVKWRVNEVKSEEFKCFRGKLLK